MLPPLLISILCLSDCAHGSSRGSTAGGSADEGKRRFTAAHQSMTFSRRMMLLGGAQAAVGGVLVGRLGCLAVSPERALPAAVARATGSS